ncbi:hypothetical protein J2X04_001627 [Lysobacter niabensis]|uniref:Uncharacterized protein n=1 Tax=Agrilutibacter niabensis TaxID=380628 RepID=A0ABU1VP71_9GAMM|nr:hypothetical protein [Lysobacter niabensis]MDR7099280.1 hypothetical protein [Lysobacter niabensis]
MSAPIIKHHAPKHPDDDPDHPIPSLAVLDVAAILKDGGADLTVVIASPLHSDERSLTRLLDKIQGYLGHIQSPEFRAEAGTPNPGNTTIKVLIHPDSCIEAFDLLDRSKDWVLANDATLKVERLDIAVH